MKTKQKKVWNFLLSYTSLTSIYFASLALQKQARFYSVAKKPLSIYDIEDFENSNVKWKMTHWLILCHFYCRLRYNFPIKFECDNTSIHWSKRSKFQFLDWLNFSTLFLQKIRILHLTSWLQITSPSTTSTVSFRWGLRRDWIIRITNKCMWKSISHHSKDEEEDEKRRERERESESKAKIWVHLRVAKLEIQFLHLSLSILFTSTFNASSSWWTDWFKKLIQCEVDVIPHFL